MKGYVKIVIDDVVNFISVGYGVNLVIDVFMFNVIVVF